ncbi:TPA: bacterial Ig-like domain-containing protein, partial [Enterococcus faecalis]|nr:bacterial Ig-like domain-containing protein [Enterococcus faecalis]
MKKKVSSVCLALLVSPYLIGTGQVFANTIGTEKTQEHENQFTSEGDIDRTQNVDIVELSDQGPSIGNISSETSEGVDNNTTQDSSENKDLMGKEDLKSEPNTGEMSSIRTDELTTENDKTEALLDENDDIASGVSGTVDWRIDSEGTLHFYPGKFAEFPIAGDFPAWKGYSQSISKIKFEGEVLAGAQFNYAFAYLSNVTQIENIHFFNTDATTSMQGTFQHMRALKQIDVSSINTANVSNMQSMFFGSTSLTSLDISNWDMTNVKSSESFSFPPNVNHIILGKKNKFYSSKVLPTPPNNDDYSYTWTNRETRKSFSNENLIGKYDGDIMAGEYMWTKKPKLNLKDITIYKNDETWTPQDNYISGTDEIGESLPFERIEVVGNQLGNVNVTKPGNYVVEYRCYYGMSNWVVGKSTVTVKDIQTKVNVHDSEFYVGTNWEAKDNFDSAIDKDG